MTRTMPATREIPLQPPTDAAALARRVDELERLITAIEDELSDAELSDELRLQHIGERVAHARDGH